MSKVKIELMKVEHIEGVMIIENLCFSIPWSRDAFFQEITQNEFAVYFVALDDSKVVGYAGIWKICNEGHITNIAVHPDFRKCGIGKLLMTELFDYAKTNFIEKMTLEVRAGNEAAKKLYEGFGFKPFGIRKEYYEDNLEDAVIMWNEKI